MANNLPVPPGFGRVELWKKNKPSKKRVKVNPNEFIKNVDELNQMIYSDKGGDGGDQYLFDFEELKKAMNDATGGQNSSKEVKPRNLQAIIDNYTRRKEDNNGPSSIM